MGNTLRVLLVEDSEDDAELVLIALRQTGHEIAYERVDTAPAFMAALNQQAWDLIICDYVMPQFRGSAALELFNTKNVDIPFIIVSGTIGEHVAVEMMKAGAHDYLMKSNLARLPVAVERELREASERRERARAEEKLRLAELRSRSLITAIAQTVMLTDAEGNLLAVEPQWGLITGLDKAHLEQGGWTQALHPADRKPVMVAWNRSLKSKEVFSVELRMRTAHGDYRWYSVRGVPVLNEDGSVREWVSLAMDIDDRKQAEKALQANEERLQQVNAVLLKLASSPNLKTGKLEDAFQEITETTSRELGIARVSIWLFNRDRSKLICQDLFELTTRQHSKGAILSATDYPAYFEALRENRFIAAHDARTDPRTSEYTKGYLVPFDITSMLGAGTRIRGELVGIVSLEHIGAKRQWKPQEEVLAGSLTDMISLALEANERKHLEAQLQQAQKMEAVGRLAGGIAHDFNNLLTTIIGYSQLLSRAFRAEDPLRQDILEIEKAGKRAAALISQLLTFSRKQVLQPKILNLNEVIQELQKMLRRLIREDIELTVNLAPNLKVVEADVGQIEQVIVNLAVNACDAMGKGGSLTITTSSVEVTEPLTNLELPSGSYAMLCITDTGIGMNDEIKSHIFEPFFTTKELGKGTGLGLSIVYGIIKQSNGYITVDSQPGIGTTFKIYLPQTDKNLESPENVSANSAIEFGTETILLVEDETAVRKLTGAILRKHGYYVLEAAEAAEALKVCKEYKAAIHMMVTDVVMPNMGGRELVKLAANLRPNMRTLYISGYTDDATVFHSVFDGDVPFLQKPFSLQSLASKVREVLDAHRPSSPSSAASNQTP